MARHLASQLAVAVNCVGDLRRSKRCLAPPVTDHLMSLLAFQRLKLVGKGGEILVRGTGTWG
jgi:hypothetical protein